MNVTSSDIRNDPRRATNRMKRPFLAYPSRFRRSACDGRSCAVMRACGRTVVPAVCPHAPFRMGCPPIVPRSGTPSSGLPEDRGDATRAHQRELAGWPRSAAGSFPASEPPALGRLRCQLQWPWNEPVATGSTARDPEREAYDGSSADFGDLQGDQRLGRWAHFLAFAPGAASPAGHEPGSA